MQRRVYLLFLLFLVLAGFYASVARENVPIISARQQAQTDRFNQLDETVLMQKSDTVAKQSGD